MRPAGFRVFVVGNNNNSTTTTTQQQQHNNNTSFAGGEANEAWWRGNSLDEGRGQTVINLNHIPAEFPPPRVLRLLLLGLVALVFV